MDISAVRKCCWCLTNKIRSVEEMGNADVSVLSE